MIGTGLSRLKRRVLSAYRSDLVIAAPGRAVGEAVRRDGAVLVWGMPPARLETEARKAEIGIVRVEDGFIRSVGLGTRQTAPASLVFDDLGIYYDARRPSRFERIAAETAFTPDLLARARALRDRLAASGVSKYNLAGPDRDLRAEAGDRRIVLVVGQVPDDAAIRHGTGRVCGNLALLGAVRRERPDAFVVYKEHPDLVVRSRPGWLPDRRVRAHADLILRAGDAIGAIRQADEVHTMTSLAGFEALIRGKPVTCWGMPFYAGWGLTDDREPIPRRTRSLTLDELVAAALILYPAYRDPVSGLPCEVERILDRIDAIRAGQETMPLATPHRRLVRGMVVAEAWIRHILGHWGRAR